MYWIVFLVLAGCLGTQVEESLPSNETVYTMEKVAKHNNRNDCWIVIDGNVYNVTDWISKHPGGVQPILNYCGKDATQAFKGKPHSAKAEQIKERYYIGKLQS